MTNEFISVELRASPRLRPALAAAHAAVAAVLAMALPPGWPLVCACLLLTANAIWLLGRSDRGGALSRFELAADRSCRWMQAHESTEGTLRADTTALPWLIVLRFDTAEPRGVRSLILFRSSMHADDWRRLQVFLRWGVQFTAAASISSGEPF